MEVGSIQLTTCFMESIKKTMKKDIFLHFILFFFVFGLPFFLIILYHIWNPELLAAAWIKDTKSVQDHSWDHLG